MYMFHSIDPIYRYRYIYSEYKLEAVGTLDLKQIAKLISFEYKGFNIHPGSHRNKMIRES